MSRFLLPLLVLTAAASASAATLEVTAVRYWTFADVTRIAIETNGEFRFQSSRLYGPDRLVFDLTGSRIGARSHRFVRREINDKLIKRVRMAQTKPGMARVVLDLEGPADYRASQLSNPDRLIVELRGKDSSPRPYVPEMTTFRQTGPLRVAARIFQPPPPPQTIFVSLPDVGAPPVIQPSIPADRTRSLFARMQVRPVLPRVTPVPVILPSASVLREKPAEKATFNSSAQAAKLAATQSLTRALGLKINRVVIDAGHGGHDQGTSGPNGLLEKDLTLDVAKRLGRLIEQRLGSEVIYTRSDDTYIPLHERTAIANRNRADLFLSIHANSSPAPSVTGVETYYLNFTNSTESLSVAARENATSERSVYELKDLIQTITLHEKIEESREFASTVQSSLQSFENRNFPASKNRGIRKAPFVVLIGASMPSILAEIGFVSNSRQENMLSKPAYRQHLAEALYEGVSKYSGSLSHFTMVDEKPRLQASTGYRALNTDHSASK